MKVKWDCVEVALSQLLGKHGRMVARYPLPYIIIPIIITGLLMIGLVNLSYNEDIEYLFTPTNGPAKDEQVLVRTLFPENHDGNFTSVRRTTTDGEVNVIVRRADNGNVYTPESFQKIIELDASIRFLDVSVDGIATNHFDVCAKWQGGCEDNPILVFLGYNATNVGAFEIFYPLTNNTFLGMQLGGVETYPNGSVISAQAIMLNYYPKYQSEEEIHVSDEWMNAILALVSNYKINLHTITYRTSLSMDQQLSEAAHGIVPLFSITYTILITFTVLSAMMLDWVRSQPWAALGGVTAACLAIFSSIGLMSAVGVPFASTVGSMPFLIIGIGIDDLFVILSAWRHTDVRHRVEDRMGETFHSAAVSITLTSLTNALAFAIGAITTFKGITIFCAYTGTAVIFCYFYAITLYAGCLVYEGRREEKLRHVATCKKCQTLEMSSDKSGCYRFWCTGGSTKDSKSSEEGIVRPWLTLFMREHFGPFLMTIPSKITTAFLYFVYLGVAIWGCTQLVQGLELGHLAEDDSYLNYFYDDYDYYFYGNYGPCVMVVMNEAIDYSNDTERDNVFNMLQTFRDNDAYYNSTELTISWLRAFESFLAATSDNPNTLGEYIRKLQAFLMFYPAFAEDVKFSEDNLAIPASRFLVQAQGITSTTDERRLMEDSRSIANDAIYETTVFHPAFIYFDQYTVIVFNTILNLVIAVCCMLVVSVLLVPSLVAILCIIASVISIIIGVIGFMSLWGISLDSISMINLIMCIGFSVDFSAHISYHFSKSKKPTGNEKVIEAIGELGTPIVQGAVSTILGVAVLAFSDCYIFRTFFKIIFLVMVFGFFHAMLVLPVLLSTLSAIARKCKGQQVDAVENKEVYQCEAKGDEESSTANIVIANSRNTPITPVSNKAYDSHL